MSCQPSLYIEGSLTSKTTVSVGPAMTSRIRAKSADNAAATHEMGCGKLVRILLNYLKHSSSALLSLNNRDT